MNPDPLARYLMRLPTLITFFFSVMLVTFFRELAVIFQLSTDPKFDWSTPADALILISFLATLFFVVAVWLAYSLLIERFPYTLDYGLFYFDVARFSVLYLVFSFAFLAGHPPSYIYYIVALARLASDDGRMARLPSASHPGRRTYQNAARTYSGHLLRMGTYLVLAVAYYLCCRTRVGSLRAMGHAKPVRGSHQRCCWSIWNARRLNDVRHKAIEASKAAELARAAARRTVADVVARSTLPWRFAPWRSLSTRWRGTRSLRPGGEAG